MIAENVGTIRERIERASRKARRDPAEITLLAVSKTFPPARIKEAVECGVHDVGENYVQELLTKRETLGDSGIRWHFIGHLQSNKVKFIAPWIHLVHAVDSARLAGEINRHAKNTGRSVDVLIEVNSTGEASKFGVPSESVRDFAVSLEQFDNIRVCGLMTMGLFLPDPEASRPLYRSMSRLRETLSGLRQKNIEMKHLSMGMTGDFEVAIEEGATIVRIGTAIFGRRGQTKPAQD